MNSKEFLLLELRNLANKFPGVSFRYEHNSAFKEHIIEVSPESTYISDVDYGNDEYTVSKKMMNLFPLETLVFVGKDSLIKVKNVSEVIPAVFINWNNFSELINKNQFKSENKQIIDSENLFALAA